jgi:hypothetical protein
LESMKSGRLSSFGGGVVTSFISTSDSDGKSSISQLGARDPV